MTSIIFPMAGIGDYAFSDCENLISITIPNCATSIGIRAFSNCSITDVFCYAEVVPSTSGSAFERSPISSATLHVPATAIELYKNAEPWNQFKSIVAITEETPDEPVDPDNPTEKPQCAKPTIVYKNGKLQFACDTEDVKYVYTITPRATSGESTNGVVNLGTSFTVSVYATREGYNDSEAATAIIDMSTVGDVNGDGLISVADVTALVNLILGRN